jgi:hypothetical protein
MQGENMIERKRILLIVAFLLLVIGLSLSGYLYMNRSTNNSLKEKQNPTEGNDKQDTGVKEKVFTGGEAVDPSVKRETVKVEQIGINGEVKTIDIPKTPEFGSWR